MVELKNILFKVKLKKKNITKTLFFFMLIRKTQKWYAKVLGFILHLKIFLTNIKKVLPTIIKK